MHEPVIVTAMGYSQAQCPCGYISPAYQNVAVAQLAAERHVYDGVALALFDADGQVPPILDARAAVREAEIIVSEHQQQRKGQEG